MTSYATRRIAETIRVLTFMTLSNLNDFPIMMIADDNTRVDPKPVRWDMRGVLTVATVLGSAGVVFSFSLLWCADSFLKLPGETVQALVFFKLLVAGHLTIYVTRNQRWFWTNPFPAMRLFVTAEAIRIIGTPIAVYGIFATPIGWTYALAWLPINTARAIGVRRLCWGTGHSTTRRCSTASKPTISGIRCLVPACGGLGLR